MMPASVWLAQLVALTLGTAPLSVVAVGAGGGVDEGDLSAWLVSAPQGGYVLLDAGSMLHGVGVAFEKGAFPEVDRKLAPRVAAAKVLREHTKAVLLSHAHLDHTAGLVMFAPDDVARPVHALAPTIDALRDHAFNWKLWPNFGSEGAPPPLKKLSYQRMEPGKTIELPGTGFRATAFPLSHAGVTSTAFLLEGEGGAVLYVGDTGPDSVEKSDRLKLLWERCAPLVRDKKLKAVFLEASYPSDRADGTLFGHLTPRHLSAELIRFATAVDGKNPGAALKGLTVIVTHIKPALDGDDVRGRIATELSQMNTLGVRFVLPVQGERLAL